MEHIQQASEVHKRYLREYQLQQELETDPVLRECRFQHMQAVILWPRQHVLLSPSDWDACFGVGGEQARQAIALYDFARHSDRCKAH